VSGRVWEPSSWHNDSLLRVLCFADAAGGLITRGRSPLQEHGSNRECRPVVGVRGYAEDPRAAISPRAQRYKLAVRESGACLEKEWISG
jgi:hypothetical protein